tara:strand:- start:49 stop:963 length:915 start_codon:yes stop_codon:yes gene_type:complete
MSLIKANNIRDNSWLFLRKAIKELISHDDSNDEILHQDKAIVAITLIQMSFELSLVAYFVESDGIQGIVKGSDISLSEQELLIKYENNELVTKSFNSLKKTASERDSLFTEDGEYFIDEFQKMRNKLVHLNYEFDDGELYDLKYDLTYFIVKVIIPTLTDEYANPSQAIAINIESNDFLKLIKFPPYAYEMHKVAKENSDNVYCCVHCNNDSLAVDFGEEYCYSCCEDLSQAGFIDCPYCNSKRSMVYDALNINCQNDRTLRALCLKCQEDELVYVCSECESEVALEANIGLRKCCPDFCEFSE